ncbi:class I SAM-dependent methyltransferase [Thermoanaerobacteraceae bacterium SP2]|nr:class I SAM-dependent methyltransferase [Thermoanaerobacteraceae bacterium SP2]
MENRAKSDMTEVIRRRYDRTSIFYDWMDRMISPELRKKALSQASGKVLEVGVGTGNNFPYYPPGCEVTAIDFSPGMLARARKKLHLARTPIKLLEMDAQAMDFPDNTFDTVVATCVFCSVPDPVKGLAEVKRVCKPNGKIILLEHVRSESPVIGWLMDVLNPISLHLIGSNINRRTVQNVISAGIQLQKVEDLRGKIVKLIVGTP